MTENAIIVGLEARNKELEDKLSIAIKMLAEWCIAVEDVGTSWDDWDEHYKNANYRPSPLREMIDKAKEKSREEYEWR